jgi:hypothetical protein
MFTEPQYDALSSHVKNVFVHFSPNERWKSSVLSARLNVNRVGSDWIDGERLFHTLAAALGSARSPMVLWLVLGT